MNLKKWQAAMIGIVGSCLVVLSLVVTKVQAEQDTSMYRLYNPNSGEHFYTQNPTERLVLAQSGWRYEGVGWVAPSQSTLPVYRLYNQHTGDHHYTLSIGEKNYLAQIGWRNEGIGWYSADKQQIPLYRSYNPNAKVGSHNYTTSVTEHQALLTSGWRDEKIGWYALKTGQSVEVYGWNRVIKQTGFDSRQIGLACLQLVNQERQKQGVAPLQWNEQAFKVADLRAWEIMLNFEHKRPDGRKLDTINYEGIVSPNYHYFGENIAYRSYAPGSNAEIAQRFFEMWKNSPGHYKNMVSANYKEIGCAFAYANGIVYGSQNFYTF